MGPFRSKKNTPIIEKDIASLNLQLTDAIAFEKLEEVTKLLNEGAEIDHINAMKLTVLKYACIHKSDEMISLLIEKGADLFVVNKKSGYTLLHTAAQRGLFWLIKLLVEKGLDVNAREKNGNGPLSTAGNKHKIRTYFMVFFKLILK